MTVSLVLFQLSLFLVLCIVSMMVCTQGVNFCPGENVTDITTHQQMNYTAQPKLFHLGKDPGEKYPIR